MSGPDQGQPCRFAPCADVPILETLYNMSYYAKENKARAGAGEQRVKKKIQIPPLLSNKLILSRHV